MFGGMGCQLIYIVSRNIYVNIQSVFWRRRSRAEFGLVISSMNTVILYPYSILLYSNAFKKKTGDLIGYTLRFATVYLRNEFNFWNVHGIMNTSGLLKSK